jgi:putative hydrolase of the HAD superfamily
VRVITSVFFDLFSTLLDAGSAPRSVARPTSEILGVSQAAWNEVCFSEHHEIRQPSDGLEIMRRLARELVPGVSESTVRAAHEERQRRFDWAFRRIEPDVLAGLDALRERGIRLVLVSNASTDEVSAWPESPLAERFDAVVFSWEAGAAKPESAIYQRACELAGSDPGQCLFVGDGRSDELVGAHEHGLHPLLMTRFLATTRADERRQRYRDVIRGAVASTAEVVDWLDASR